MFNGPSNSGKSTLATALQIKIAEMLEGYNINFVHVTCPLNILKEREAKRQNRCIGSAKASFEYLFPKNGYDITIDAYYPQHDCVLKIIDNSREGLFCELWIPIKK